jgi:hypothetical protein
LRIYRSEAQGLLSKADAKGRILVWPLAENYSVEGKLIVPVGGRREGSSRNQFPRPSPLRDDGLASSFAKLGARGNPSPKKILGWVNDYGLLARQDEVLPGDADLDGRVNQVPVSVEDFRIEVLRVYDILTLYSEIKEKDVDGIKARIENPRSWLDDRLAHGYDTDIAMPDGSAKMNEYTKAVVLSTLSTAPRPELWHADRILHKVITESVDSVRLQAVSGFALPDNADWDNLLEFRAATPKRYSLGQSFRCSDLRCAIYLQLFLIVTANKPMRICAHPNCPMPFPLTRRNRIYCSRSCKRGARYYR